MGQTAAAVLCTLLFAAFTGVSLGAVSQIGHTSIAWTPLYLDPSAPMPINDPRLARNVTGVNPEQIHLTYQTTDSVAVSWATGVGVTSIDALPEAEETQNGVATIVLYGTDAGNLTQMAMGFETSYTQTYTQLNESNLPLNYTSPLLHHTILTELEPDTTYFYQCGDPKYGLSEEYSFTTAPAPGPGAYPLVLGVVADVGQTINSSMTIQHLSDSKPKYVTLIGDLTYADDTTPNGTATTSNGTVATYPDSPIGSYQPRWDSWYRMMQPLLSGALFIPTHGNHELEPQGNASYYSGLHRTPDFPEGSQFQSYLNRNPIPHNQSNSNNPLWYSVEFGPVHMIHLTNYDDFSTGSEQYNWLLSDLNTIDRVATPWIVATWHAPWYSSYTTHYKETECMREAMEDVLYEAGVDIVLNGHLHTYERSNPVYNYTVEECGIVHITMGDGGNIEGLYKKFIDQPDGCPAYNGTRGGLPKYQPGPYCPSFTYPGGPNDGYCSATQPDWSAFRQPAFGHGLLTFINDTHTHWQWNRNLDSEMVYADDVYIIRNLNCPNQAAYAEGPSSPSTGVAVAGRK